LLVVSEARKRGNAAIRAVDAAEEAADQHSPAFEPDDVGLVDAARHHADLARGRGREQQVREGGRRSGDWSDPAWVNDVVAALVVTLGRKFETTMGQG
jgi:hypothetical protein